MKTFLIFLLTFIVVTGASAAPTATEKVKIERTILEEIIESVKRLDDTLSMDAKEIMVAQVITTKNCTPENFCKAGKVLEALKANDLRLQEEHWLLPRKLVAYTRDIQCKEPKSDNGVELHEFLHQIKQCAQKNFIIKK